MVAPLSEGEHLPVTPLTESSSKTITPQITVTPASASGSVFPAWHHLLLQVGTTITFAVASLCVWVYGYTFWTIIEAVVRAGNFPQGRSLFAPLLALLLRQTLLSTANGWPFDAAILLAFAATWGTLYLTFDHLVLFGNARAKALLQGRVSNMANGEPFFVELRATDKSLGIAPDIGFIQVTPAGLHFTGDRQTITIPRNHLFGTVLYRASFGDLSAASVIVPLSQNRGTLCLVGRDTATKLSDTRHDSKRLFTAVEQYLTAPQSLTKGDHERD